MTTILTNPYFNIIIILAIAFIAVVCYVIAIKLNEVLDGLTVLLNRTTKSEKYIYEIRKINFDVEESGCNISPDEMIKQKLCEWGNEGWELVFFAIEKQQHIIQCAVCILKKKS